MQCRECNYFGQELRDIEIARDKLAAEFPERLGAVGHQRLFDRLVKQLFDERVMRVLAIGGKLRDVPGAVTAEAIAAAVRVTRDGLVDWFGVESPRIALCALNPHAGDGGRFGTEDDTILAPAAHRAGIPTAAGRVSWQPGLPSAGPGPAPGSSKTSRPGQRD